MIDPDEMGVRTDEELYQRLIALWVVVVKAKVPDYDFPFEYLTHNNLLHWLSPLERKYLSDDKPTERADINYSWRAEAVAFLGWCAGIVSNIELEGDTTDPEELIDLLPENFDDNGERLRTAIKIRTKSELAGWSNRLFIAHAKMRSAERGGNPVPSTWSIDKIVEWHTAINWMLYFLEDPQDWDEVTTDT